MTDTTAALWWEHVPFCSRESPVISVEVRETDREDVLGLRIERADGTVSEFNTTRKALRGSLWGDGVRVRGECSIAPAPKRPPRLAAVIGTVYFLRAVNGGPVKIGFTSRRVDVRLAQIQTTHPHRLHVLLALPGSMDHERELHAHFAAHRLEGEWFSPAPELLAFIEAKRGEVQP